MWMCLRVVNNFWSKILGQLRGLQVILSLISLSLFCKTVIQSSTAISILTWLFSRQDLRCRYLLLFIIYLLWKGAVIHYSIDHGALRCLQSMTQSTTSSASGATASRSQKAQGFCVADFARLSDERRSHSKIVLLLNSDKRTLRSKI